MQVNPFTERERPAGAALCATAVALALIVGGCGGGSNGDKAAGTATAAAGGGAAKTASLKCGLGNGKKASGTPVKIGAIVTQQPGTDFTDITNAAKAYFDCVNDNGGINGKPVSYLPQPEQTDPAQVASLAKKLAESEQVVAVVGNTSLIECAVNHKYWESKGYSVIDSGIAPECYSTPNSAAVNMGPRYSSDGAVQSLIGKGVKKIAFVQSNVPGTGYIEAGPKLVAAAAKIPIASLKENVPIQDANSAALKAVQAAGNGGGVVLNFTPPEALKILQAAQRQGLQDRVKWGCSTPCNTDFLANALGSAWNDKLFVNAELNLTTADGPDSELYRNVIKQYAPKIPLGSFSQMGFLEAKIATTALLTVKGDITVESANQAIRAVKDFKTDILCQPWYYGDAPLHIPNNVDRTTTPKDGVMVQDEDCFKISDAEPDIAKVRQFESQQ
jgi:branched-chain amino acid transport system substrate-binding protein